MTVTEEKVREFANKLLNKIDDFDGIDFAEEMNEIKG